MNLYVLFSGNTKVTIHNQLEQAGIPPPTGKRIGVSNRLWMFWKIKEYIKQAPPKYIQTIRLMKLRRPWSLYLPLKMGLLSAFTSLCWIGCADQE